VTAALHKEGCTSPMSVVLAIDNSGSMSGSAIEHAKAAAIAFTEIVMGVAQRPLLHLHLVVFESRAVHTDLTGKSFDDIK
jgi:uncharacterized protein with von Willebrand factor type A (vWA) domain